MDEVLSGKLNKPPAALLYGIKGNATILYWINQSRASMAVKKNHAGG
ncbi:MAG: hypothetical protein IPI66_11195 [Chitinophagaceae bacterium]|nr:hypothetical protein [Chitinophagaceae bacterium]